MKMITCNNPDLKILEPKVFSDERGFFLESYNQKELSKALGFPVNFVQDNHSQSLKHVLRGLHYQIQHPQGKLIRVISGEIYDVAVDIRKGSPFFGQWQGTTLSSANKLILWVPSGFAHGFLVLSDSADVVYKTTDFYHPESERCIHWDDPDLAIEWPIDGQPIVSKKDGEGKFIKQADLFP